MNIQNYSISIESISEENKKTIINILKEKDEFVLENSTIYNSERRHKDTYFHVGLNGSYWSTTSQKPDISQIEITPEEFIKKFKQTRFNYCLKDK